MGCKIWGSNSGMGKGFMSSPKQLDGHWQPPASYLMSKREFIPWG